MTDEARQGVKKIFQDFKAKRLTLGQVIVLESERRRKVHKLANQRIKAQKECINCPQ